MKVSFMPTKCGACSCAQQAASPTRVYAHPRSTTHPQTTSLYPTTTRRTSTIAHFKLYGNDLDLGKQATNQQHYTTGLDPAAEAYIQKYGLRTPHPILDKCHKETAVHDKCVFQIPHHQGQYMFNLLQLIGAKRCIDVGTYTGYSALVAALAVPEDGLVVAMDVNSNYMDWARRYFEEANVGGIVREMVGSATDSLQALLAEGQAGTFDCVFIDADKEGYDGYYELALQLVRPGGLVVLDNMLWYGKVWAASGEHDGSTAALVALADKIASDERVAMDLLPVGDGVLVCRKVW